MIVPWVVGLWARTGRCNELISNNDIEQNGDVLKVEFHSKKKKNEYYLLITTIVTNEKQHQVVQEYNYSQYYKLHNKN